MSWRKSLAVLVLLGVVLGAPALAQPASVQPELAQLMAAFARMPGLEARFVEKKRIGLLAQPLESRGQLFFARPGLLLRRVESPRRSEVLITPKELKLRDADGEQSIDLRARPDVRPFVESLTWLLAGDQKALASVYALQFERGDKQAPWKLTLTPRAEPLAHLIAYVRVQGSGLAVQEIRVHEKGGDESVTEIVEANPARKYEPAELKSLFGVEAASLSAHTSAKP